jgi:hypothetical protein
MFNDLPRTAALLCALCLVAPAHPQSTHPLADGSLLFDSRLRLEQVEDDAFARDASALTWRNRLGFRTAPVAGWYALVEVEDVQALIDDYNDTANGQTNRPLVADPEGSEWNQVHLGWQHANGHGLVLGRQRLSLDNHRFIGNVGWRQNEQTFDAVAASLRVGADWSLRYAWLDEVHRIFGNNHPNPLAAEQDLDTHAFNLAGKLAGHPVVGYGYWYDNQDLPLTSTRTLGLRLSNPVAPKDSGSGRHWLYTLEYANQSDYAQAPDSGSVDYWLLEAGIMLEQHALRAGVESLGSNGRRAVQTPLATLHAFNGWADRFLVTPGAGLEDLYIGADGPIGPLRYGLRWHDFRAQRGSADYGSELDAQLGWAFQKGWNAQLKYARYQSDGFASDQSKLWLSLEYRWTD